MSKAKGVSGGKRGSVMKGMGKGKPTFAAYTGNIVQSGKSMGKGKGTKKAVPGKNA